jgi:CRP/FNR family transcriptional regulator, cyclic AMP receptor protein
MSNETVIQSSAGATRPAILEEIAEHPFLAGLSQAHLTMLAHCALRSHFAAGEQIFREGDPANRFYLLKSGRVVLETIKDGKRKTLQFIGAREVLGWSWLYPPYYCHFDARAMEATAAIFLYGARLRELCEEDHDLGYELMKRTTTVLIDRLTAAWRGHESTD